MVIDSNPLIPDLIAFTDTLGVGSLLVDSLADTLGVGLDTCIGFIISSPPRILFRHLVLLLFFLLYPTRI